MSRQPLDYQSPPPRRAKSRAAASVLSATVRGGAIGAALTLPAIVLVILFAGGGHGNYFFARFFFPYPTLLTTLTDNSIARPSILLAFVQLPLEGALIGLALSRDRLGYAIAVGGAHVVAFVVCSSLRNFVP